MKIPFNPDKNPNFPPVPLPDFPKPKPIPDFPGTSTQAGNLPETQKTLAALSNLKPFDGKAQNAILDLYKASLADNSPAEIGEEYESVKSARQMLELMARSPEMDRQYQALLQVEQVLSELHFGFSPEVLPDFPPLPGANPEFEFLADN